MKANVNSVLTKVSEQISPFKNELKEIEKKLKYFLTKLKNNSKKLKLEVEVFVGGSFAKKTIIRKKEYDVDIFLRFDKKYENKELSKLAEKILKGIVKRKIHGSRDYFEVEIDKNLFFEIIPVRKVKNTKNSENITDLSYSHVSYVRKKLKSEKILRDVKIDKAFFYANKLYGAESYIGGFSGYSLELLIYHYGSFLKFLKSVLKEKKKIVIDTEKQFKNKQQVLMDLNAAKLDSPIVLVDPTYKYRNVLAALTNETFEDFKGVAKKFLENPSENFFVKRKVNFEKTINDAKKKKLEVIMFNISTNKQKGSIAGSKLKKFYTHLTKEVERYFEIKIKVFEYSDNDSATCLFVVKSKKEIFIIGPEKNQKENVKKFKKAHKRTVVKKGRICAREKINFDLKQFFGGWIKKHKEKIQDMSIVDFKLI